MEAEWGVVDPCQVVVLRGSASVRKGAEVVVLDPWVDWVAWEASDVEVVVLHHVELGVQ